MTVTTTDQVLHAEFTELRKIPVTCDCLRQVHTARINMQKTYSIKKFHGLVLTPENALGLKGFADIKVNLNYTTLLLMITTFFIKELKSST